VRARFAASSSVATSERDTISDGNRCRILAIY
jgi:hypothetical protein